MSQIRCIIVDDEPLAIEGLKLLIQKIDDLVLLADFDNAVNANNFLSSTKEIDLIFTDVQMPQISGTEWIQSLQKPPMVIFTSAHPDFAVKGFELDAVDFLLKPISLDRFLKAINKAKVYLSSHQHESKAEDEFIFLRSEGRYEKILLKEILYVEGLKDYVKIFIDNGKPALLTAMNLKTFFDKLASKYFVRTHKSFILNTNKISSFDKESVFIGKMQLPLGDSFKDEFFSVVTKGKILKR